MDAHIDPARVAWDSQPIESWAERHAEGRTLMLDGRRTHYVERGEARPGVPPLILIHGFFYDHFMWADNIDALARERKVYAIDLWGCGFSTRDPLPYGYPLYAGQLRLFMDALGIERAALCGQSMGAGTSIRFAIDHPHRVERLILVAAAALPNPMPPLARLVNLPGIGEFLMGLQTDFFLRTALRDIFVHDASRVTDAYFQRVTLPVKIAGAKRAGLAIQRARFFDSLGDDIPALAALKLPIQLVWGRQDKAIPLRLGERLHAMLPGSRLDVLDQAGHVPNFDQAERFNALATEFLRG